LLKGILLGSIFLGLAIVFFGEFLTALREDRKLGTMFKHLFFSIAFLYGVFCCWAVIVWEGVHWIRRGGARKIVRSASEDVKGRP
jgi:hypothetical protein